MGREWRRTSGCGRWRVGLRRSTIEPSQALQLAGRASDAGSVACSRVALRGDGGWLDARSPDGEFRRLADTVGALEDGYLGLDEMQAMFAQALRERGHSVFYEVMPGSNHYSVGDDGWETFVAAFQSAALVD